MAGSASLLGNCGVKPPRGRDQFSLGRNSIQKSINTLFRETHDLVEMFPLFDRVEYERRPRLAGETETHSGSGILPASIGGIAFLSETRRPGDRLVQTAGLHDRLHRE
jgi:hypothetical protein